MINKDVITALKGLNVPVSFITYSGTASTYITFTVINENSALDVDDVEAYTRYLVQVDVFSKNDYTELVSKAITNMEESNFKRILARDFYESDTKLFHKVIRFSYFIKQKTN